MNSNPAAPGGEALNRELDALFAAYRDACPAPEPSPDFMPRLWQAIEARRSTSYTFGRWTRAFVTAAAAICVVLGLLQKSVSSQPSFYHQTYIESLQSEIASSGSQTILEALWPDEGGAGPQ
jgi:hypothetical protein